MSQVTITHPLTGQQVQMRAELLLGAAKLAADRIADAHAKIEHYARAGRADQVAVYRASLDKLLAAQASINAAMGA